MSLNNQLHSLTRATWESYHEHSYHEQDWVCWSTGDLGATDNVFAHKAHDWLARTHDYGQPPPPPPRNKDLISRDSGSNRRINKKNCMHSP